MIEVSHLVKRYGQKTALDDVSFTVNDGEILGFLGPNGAGKSTTMNILTGYLSSSAGTATIDGYEILERPIQAKKRIGYLPDVPPLYPDMKVKDYLSFMFDLKKVKLPKNEHIREICGLVKIDNVYERIIKNLSKGYKQRVGLAQALLGNPPVLILDEPTVGLDPKQIIEIRSLIKSLKSKHTVILSSHVLSEIQATCDRVLVINNGKIVADDTPENLSKNISERNQLIASIQGEKDAVKEILARIDGIKSVTAAQESEPGVFLFEIEALPEKDVRQEVFKALAKADMPILSLQQKQLNLEDIFLQLTNETGANEEEPSPEVPEENSAFPGDNETQGGQE